MRMARMALGYMVALQLAACSPPLRPARTLADNEVQRVMKREGVQGLAIATIENGKVARVRAFGTRNAALGLPLTPDTVMYGASLTKTAFCYMLLQMADEGLIDLDAPVASLLPQPLPSYRDKPFDFSDLGEDPRWRTITPRMLMLHSGGFANFRWIEPDGKLRMHFDPGSRYAYSGEGFYILQLIVERGLKLDLGPRCSGACSTASACATPAWSGARTFIANAGRGLCLRRQPCAHDRALPPARGRLDGHHDQRPGQAVGRHAARRRPARRTRAPP
jgi:hypothetical protein